MQKELFDDDLYDGFLQPSMENLFYDLEMDENFQHNGLSRLTTRNIYSRGNTSSELLRSAEKSLVRPSTAVPAAGYTSEAGRLFDPMLNQNNANRKGITLGNKIEEPIEKYKNLEKKISNLLEESILISTGSPPDNTQGLAKAKEASSLDRTLHRLRDQDTSLNQNNFELTYAVFFNLANMYTKNGMFVEAVNTLNMITKSKMFPNANRLKINLGNMYFRTGIYPKAIKMYRMALDQVPSNQKELRLKITQNIGILFLKMGQYTDAAASFEYIMSEESDIKSAINLILCYYAIGDKEKIKKAFKTLVSVHIENEDYIKTHTDLVENENDRQIIETIKTDKLANYINRKSKTADKSLASIINFISPVIEDSFIEGYNWCIEIIKSSNFAVLATELEMHKALIYLRQNDINQAIDILKFYEKMEASIAVSALTNLSFIFIQIEDYENAAKYSESCRKLDNYNPAAFINSGVCEIMKGRLDIAKNYIEAALEIDMTLFEGIYNLGIILKRQGNKKSALACFEKIRSNLTHAKHSHICYQIANINENLGDDNQALEWYLQLIGMNQDLDPGIYKRIGTIYENQGDRQEANHNYSESFRLDPSNISMASSIGSYYIQLQAAEKAVYHYERAVLANPNDPNFLLRSASCYRYTYSPRKYVELFENIHQQFPESLSAIRALLHVTDSFAMTELNTKYNIEYARIEKLLKSRQKSSSSGSRSSNRDNESATTTQSTRSQNGSDNSLKYSNNEYRNQTNPQGIFGATYSDPLGPPNQRPKTGYKQTNSLTSHNSDDDINADELLPI